MWSTLHCSGSSVKRAIHSAHRMKSSAAPFARQDMTFSPSSTSCILLTKLYATSEAGETQGFLRAPDIHPPCFNHNGSHSFGQGTHDVETAANVISCLAKGAAEDFIR